MAASEQDLFACFDRLGITTTTHRHPPLHTVAESRDLRGDIAGGHCKSLFLKDKKGQYLLVVMLEDRQLDMVALFKSGRLPIKRLSFASPEAMVDLLGVTPGAVTPFALINASPENLLRENLLVVLDARMMTHDQLNYHPLHNAATTTIKAPDLTRFIRHCGFDPVVLDFDNL